LKLGWTEAAVATQSLDDLAVSRNETGILGRKPHRVHGPEDEPEGLISHVCAVVGDGLKICDVWRSQEDLDDFLQNRLGPAVQQLGLNSGGAPTVGALHHQFQREAN
jgi:hypothetical protein